MFSQGFGYYGISFLSENFFDAVTNDDSDTAKYWKVAVTTSSELPGIYISYIYNTYFYFIYILYHKLKVLLLHYLHWIVMVEKIY